MATLIAFEVHTYESGSWQIASIFDDKELALIEARRIEEGLRHHETRVVEETYDEESGRTKSKEIYSSPKIRTPESAATQSGAPATVREYPKPKRRRSAATEKRPSLVVAGLTFVLILGLGIAALLALEHLSNLG
jgi:hypothetical protein